MVELEKSIVVTIIFKLVNPNKFFIEAEHYNEKLHIVDKQVDNGLIVNAYMMAMTHQYIAKTKNVETSIKWAVDKLKKIHPHVVVTKTSSKYVKTYQ